VSDIHPHRIFHYDTACLAYVTKVYPIDASRRLYVDATPCDNRGLCIKALVMTAPGFNANFRKGQTVSLHFVNGNPQNPIVTLGHFNSETPGLPYANPLPIYHENIDDVTLGHFGSGAYIRSRGLHSLPGSAQVDGAPGLHDIGLQSGLKVTYAEYPPDASTTPPIPPVPGLAADPIPPPKPTRANVTIAMPSGLHMVLDEPATGQATVAITHPSGATVTMAADGSIVSHSPVSVTTDAAGTVTETPPVAVAASFPTAPGFPTVLPKVFTLHDGNGNVISHVAASVGLGSLFSELSSAEGAFNQTHMQNQIAEIKRHVGKALQQSAQAAVLSGVPNSGAWLAAIKGGLPSLDFADLLSSMAPLALVEGSPNVRLVTGNVPTPPT
jgi:hypothetical protein